MYKLDALLKDRKKSHGISRVLLIYELFAEWNKSAKEIFGNKKIVCKPRVLKGKTLIIDVDNSSLAQELQLRQYQLISKINAHFGKTLVDRIIFKQ